MPPKRAGIALSSSTPKKAKTSHSQTKLDGFFKSPSASPSKPVRTTVAQPREVIVIDEDDDRDLALALRLSREEAVEAVTLSDEARAPIKASSSKRIQVFGAHAPVSSQPIWPDLSQDPLIFEPGSKPPWKGDKAPYSFLAHALVALSATKSRILILNTLTNTLRSLSVHDRDAVVPAMYLLSNGLSPVYLSVELGIGSGILSKALQHISGLSPATLRKLYHDKGDPGDVAFEAKSSLRTLIAHAPLSILGVHESLLKIAYAKGQGSAKQKQAIVEQLIVSAQGEEVRYLVRTLGQNLRVGAVRTTLLTALARAACLHAPDPCKEAPGADYYIDHSILSRGVPLHPGKKSGQATAAEDGVRTHVRTRFAAAEAIVRRTFSQHPNYQDIITPMFDYGLHELAQRVGISVGVPLHPALGSPTRALDEIYEKLGGATFTAELKLDGQRGQIHATRRDASHADVKIFSRHLEDMTEKYPDIAALVDEMFKVDSTLSSFIIDAEVVAIDKNTKLVRSFQELSNRPRKDVVLSDIKIFVGVYVFDLLLLNGQILIEEPLRRRRDLLRSSLPPFDPPNHYAACLRHMENCDSDEGRDAIEEFWQKALHLKTEGFMCKLLDHTTILERTSDEDAAPRSRRKPLLASYEPDKRTFSWLKLKRDYIDGLGDSLDLVPIGAWHGNGRKAQWWSPILLAVMDQSSGTLVALCKCMSGFTDEFYKGLNERYPIDSETCSRSSQWNVETGGLRPAVYFKPSEVWEVKGADITISPTSVAALGVVTSDKGLSLRFPRFIRVREEKSLEQASGPDLLVKIWEAQKHKPKGGTDDFDLVDVDWNDEPDDEADDDAEEFN
ncbi:ATP-dependent DNA ligase [Auriculariales sp. MPI-PUGE-AT-0066]|nr:ATP-dependent DNA ligase [Auriculariales sp. MPI-PUGE-AT-0066]